ncbi:MAG: MFS transporter [Candidatus Cloacimonetes bacterium]|nr:MFS transporter [Candidatus Cloacimonadota bacterium]MBL7085498.1 MFS transporter [Candidatus Cloacimonadota bacterium]
MGNEKSSNLLTVITVSIAIFLTNMDISIVNIALPTLSKIYNVDTSEVSRVILMYLLSMVSFLLVCGKLSDIKGSERIFKYGFAVFTISSLLCSLAPNLHFLNIFRFAQGIGGAMLLATFGAIVVKYLPADKRGRAFGFIIVFGGVGYALGAPVGGLLIQYLSWRWIFLINIPIGIGAMFLANSVLNKKNPTTPLKNKFDILGALLSFVGLISFLYMLNSGKDAGWLSLKSVTLFFVSILCFILFIFQEKKFPSPIMDITVFRNKHLAFGLLTIIFAIMILGGMNFLFPFFFDFVRKLSPGQTGLLLMIFPLTTTLVSPVSGYFSDKKSPKLICCLAMIFLTISCILFFFFNIERTYYFIIFSFIIFGISVAMFSTSNTTLIMSHATAGNEGMLSASLSVFTKLGSAIGISFFEIIYSLKFTNKADFIVQTNKIVDGFRNAALFGVVVGILGVLAAIISKEKR